MKQATASNVVLLLVALRWVPAHGVLSQLGDPSPTTHREQIESYRQQSTFVLLIGVLFLPSSLWLSGYSFSAAKVRSCPGAGFMPLKPNVGAKP